MAIDWTEKLDIIAKGNATYDMTEDDRDALLKRIEEIRNQLDEVECLVNILEWITPHGYKEILEHLVEVNQDAERVVAIVEGTIFRERKDK
jgi:hypothetical protein